MSKLDKFIPDGSKIRLYGSGNLSAGTIQVANETLLLSGPSAHVGISDGNNLVFLGDGQTIGVSGANTLNVGFSGNTVNLNVGGVNYVFPDSLTSSGTGAFLTTGAGDARYVQYTETGAFASNVNLQTVSGRVSSVSGTTQALSGQTQGLQGQINTINAKTGTFVTTAQTGQFYAANNPSGFITAAEAGGVQSLNVTGKSISGVIVLTGVGVNVTSAGQTITIGISTGQFLTTGAGDSRYIQYTETGAFASNVNLQTVSGSVAAINAKTGTFITSAQTGRFVDTGSNQTISGIKTFRGGIYTYGNVDIRDSNSLTTAQLNWRALYDKSESLSLDWGERILSGTWTGQALIIDGFPVLTQGSSGQFLTTGAADARYIQYTETGAFASNVNLQTVSGRVSSVSGSAQALSGQTQGLQAQITTINNKTGVFITDAQTGQFYAANNPAGYITSAEVSGTGVTYVAGLTASIGVIGGGNVSISTGTPNSLIISGATGAFASNVNLQTISGRVNSISGQTQALSGQTQGLQSQISTINVKTGAFLTTGAGDNRYIQYIETGAFASNVNLQTVSGRVNSVSGTTQALSGQTQGLQGQINTISTKTGAFLTTGAGDGRYIQYTATGAFASSVNLTTISGRVDSVSGTTQALSGQTQGLQAQINSINSKSGAFLTTGAGDTRYVKLTETGAFASNVNLQTISGQVSTINAKTGTFVTTGAGDARYIQYTETGAFASNVNLQTISGKVNSVSGQTQALSGQTQGLQGQINTINTKTGAFLTTGAGDARYIQYSTTGAFASNVNLQTVSGRVNSVSGTTQALSGQTQGLQSQISTVVAKTGAFLTTGAGDGRYIQYTETGAFASNVNLQTISGKTGTYVTTGESRYVHFSGLVEMDDVKYVVRDQDANVHVMKTNVSASFINSTGGIVLNTSIPRNVSRRIDILVRGGDYASKSQTSTWFKTIIQTSSYLNGNIDGLPGAIFIAKNINLGNNQDCPVYAGVGKNGCIALGIGTTGFINRYVWYNADVWVGDTSPSDYSTGWYWSLETGANLSFGDIVEVPNTFPYTSGGSGGSPLTDVVYTTGNQSIYGVKSYLNSIWTNGFAAYSGAYIYDSTENGFLSFNADARALYDANESTSLKWGTRQLTGTWHVQNLLISGNKVLTGTAGGAGVESITISGGASYAGALTFTGVNGITISGSGSQLLFNATNHRVVTPRDIYDSPPTGAGTWWSGYTTGVGIGSGPNAGDFWVDWRSGENFSYTLMKGANGFVWLPHVYMTGSIEAKTIFVSFINTGAGMPASSQHPFGWRGEPIYWSLGGFSYLYTDYTGLANIGLGTPTSPAVDVFMFRKINGMVIGSKFAEYALINQGV